MRCPECRSLDTESEGHKDPGVELFECHYCGHQFDETEDDG